ncbi:MAG: sodium:calcium antiporter [Candidatus Lokiarchaeota archaeon]|nr:sodium:calcium antiporter [Candidatus Lokiarchaeota archaeon]
MTPATAIIIFVIGIAIVVYSAEKLVKGIVGLSLRFVGLSAFLITTIFLGFDPENLFVGATGTIENLSGIALGSIIGATMVAITLALGITVLFVELKFKKISKSILAVSFLSGVLLLLLSIDGTISRPDGIVLLGAFGLSIYYLSTLSKKGIDIKPAGEIKESLKERQNLNKQYSIYIFTASLIGIIVGSEFLIRGAKPIINYLGLTDTIFGMTLLALLISIEELARELPAALKGRSDITFGNIVGSILHFFLLNAGLIALVNPIKVDRQTLYYYFPIVLITILLISLFILRKKIPRWAGAVFIAIYVIFFIGSYI